MTAGRLKALLAGLKGRDRIQFTVSVPARVSGAFDEKGRPLDLELVMDGGVVLDPDATPVASFRFTTSPMVLHEDKEE